MRRGHSDGEMFGFAPSSSHREATERRPASGERRMGSLGHAQEPNEEDRERMSIATKRTAMMVEDRRRRLSGYLDDPPRRSSSNSLSFDNSGNSRRNHSSTYAPSQRSSFEFPNSPANPLPPRITDRPLPRRPSEERLHNRRSREITLPKWQPDAEVSTCPICGTPFGLWYRKHHCRKCGRVVCAKCSPHRITIPRQFIVHPPDEAFSCPESSHIEIVDLTGDDDVQDSALPNERPQSSDYRIDPALGGGLEVRLCNPCVPDPNPLPHVSYLSTQHPPNFYSRPDRLSSSLHHNSSNSLGSGNDHPMGSLRRTSSGRQSNDPAAVIANMSPFVGQSTSRRHSHVARPAASAMVPPHLATVFGSAPDQSAQQVSLTDTLTPSLTDY